MKARTKFLKLWRQTPKNYRERLKFCLSYADANLPEIMKEIKEKTEDGDRYLFLMGFQDD